MVLEDYRRLTSTIAGIEGKFLSTINDHETIREIFQGFSIEEVRVGYSIGKKAESRVRYGKLMVRNYGWII